MCSVWLLLVSQWLEYYADSWQSFSFGNSVFFYFKHSSTGTCWGVEHSCPNSGHKKHNHPAFFPFTKPSVLGFSLFPAFLKCLLYVVLVQPVSCVFWPEECECVVDVRVLCRAEQLIEILSKSQYGQVQYPNRKSCNSWIKVKCVTAYHYKWRIVMLQRWPGLQIIFSRYKGTCLFGTDPRKNHIIIIFIFFSVKMKFQNSHWNCDSIAISVKIIAIWFFFAHRSALVLYKAV